MTDLVRTLLDDIRYVLFLGRMMTGSVVRWNGCPTTACPPGWTGPRRLARTTRASAPWPARPCDPPPCAERWFHPASTGTSPVRCAIARRLAWTRPASWRSWRHAAWTCLCPSEPRTVSRSSQSVACLAFVAPSKSGGTCLARINYPFGLCSFASGERGRETTARPGSQQSASG